MPYKIEQRKNKFAVVNQDTGEVMGEHASKEKAAAQMRALYASENTKALDLSYVKSLNLDSLPSLAVKSLGGDAIQGYMVIWGHPDKVDVEREFFTKSTDFWDASLQNPRPLTWDHAQDPNTKASPIVGTITDMGDDEVGRWYTAQLDRAHRYRKAIAGMIEQGLLGSSSDSAPQYVIREKAKSGAVYLKRWPLFAGALTTTPAEPRTTSVEFYKSIGISLPEAETQPEALEAAMCGRYELAHAKYRILKLGE